MIQAKFSLQEQDIDFLQAHRRYGFKDKSEMVRSALQHLRTNLETLAMEESAELYASLYAEDQELQALTASALTDWPEA